MYSFEELRSAPPNKLVAEVNNRLKSIGEAGMLDRIPLALEAQLFINELLRRDQDKQTDTIVRYTRWMTINTAVITFMTLLILVLTASLVFK